jgi:hypothetical protein
MHWLDKKYLEGILPVDVNNPKFPAGSVVETLADDRKVGAGSKCVVMNVHPGGYELRYTKLLKKDGVVVREEHIMFYLGEHCLKEWEG